VNSSGCNRNEGGNKMRFEGAVITEQGVTFAVVLVQSRVINSPTEADKIIAAFQVVFSGIPVVLMALDHGGVPTYYGREDISRFMASVPIQAIQWKEYSINI
jgi:signal recognition particle receptor subunit beta